MWNVRKPNHPNDRSWAKSIKDIEDDERYREIIQNQACIGIWIIFTTRKWHSIIKDKEKFWKGHYFCDTVLIQHVFPFLKNEENVMHVNEVTFVDDKAPCMKANMTQQLIQDNDVSFWSNNIWPRDSPDLNAAEHIGSIIKDEVKKKNVIWDWTWSLSWRDIERSQMRCLRKHGNK